MKKILVVMIAFVLGMAITSCKQSPKAVDAADAADPAKTLIEIVEKAKAEGANWTVEEWKEVFTTAMKSIAPTLLEVQELTESIMPKEGEEIDSAKVASVLYKLQEMENNFIPVQEALNQFDSISKSYPNGKAVSEDKEFEKALLKELGLELDK